MKANRAELPPLPLNLKGLTGLEAQVIPQEILQKLAPYRTERDLLEAEYRKTHPHEALPDKVRRELLEKYGLTGVLESHNDYKRYRKPVKG